MCNEQLRQITSGPAVQLLLFLQMSINKLSLGFQFRTAQTRFKTQIFFFFNLKKNEEKSFLGSFWVSIGSAGKEHESPNFRNKDKNLVDMCSQILEKKKEKKGFNFFYPDLVQ